MLELIGEEVHDFYKFLKYPRQDIFLEKLNLENFLPLLLSYYCIFICGLFLMTPLAAIAGLESMPHALQDLQDMNKWALFLLAVVTQPFLEELFFRFPLRYPRLLIMLMCSFVGMIIYMLLSKFVSGELFGFSSPTVIATIMTLVLMIILLLFGTNDDGKVRIKNFVTKYFPHLFYTVAVYFAFVHFFNFETTGHQWIFTPIMVLPQLIIALFVGYTRLKYGFLSAVIIHMINNLIPILFILQLSPK